MPTDTSTNPERASAWEWAQVALVAANLAWLSLQSGGFRPEPMAVAAALNGLLLAVHFASRMFPGDASAGAARLHPAGWLFLPFLIFAAANVLLVTPVRWLGWFDWLLWAQMLAVFWVVLNGVRSAAPRAALLGALLALAAAQVALGCWQVFGQRGWTASGRPELEQFIGRASGGLGIPNNLATLLLLVLPAAGALALRRGRTVAGKIGWGALSVFLAAGLVLTMSRGGWLALALVLAAWPLCAARGPLRRRLALAAGVVAAVAVLGVLLYVAVPKARERMGSFVQQRGETTRPVMWRAAWQTFLAHPAAGAGAGSYELQFEAHRPLGFRDQPVAAHNEYLQVLAELGAGGFALFFGAVAWIAWRTARGRGAADPLGPALAAGLAAFALHLTVEFPFRLLAVAMAFATVAALAVQLRWPAPASARPPRSPARARALAAACALAAVAGMFLGVVPRYRAEALRLLARERIDDAERIAPPPAVWRAQLAGSRDALARATALAPDNAAAWADRAYAAALASREPGAAVSALGREAEAYARRALALAPAVADHWVRLGVALDVQGRWLDAGDAFTRALQIAPMNARLWFHDAYHLSLDPTMLALARSSVATCLRLDPSSRDGETLRRNLAARR